MTERKYYSQEIFQTKLHQHIKGKTFSECAILVTDSYFFEDCSFDKCAFLKLDGTVVTLDNGSEHPCDDLPMSVVKDLGPRIRALGCINFTRDLYL